MRGKGEGSIFKNGQGLWEIRVELPPRDGKRRRKVIRRKNKADAVAELRRVQKDLAQKADLPTASTRLDDFLDYYMREVAERTVRPSATRSYRSIIERHIKPVIGKTRLDKVTPTTVRRLVAHFDEPRAEGKPPYSPTYARNAFEVLSAALRIAEQEGRIGRNPCELMDAPRKAVKPREALTLPEAIKVLRWLAEPDSDGQTKPNAALWATYLLTGARRGEILGLEVDRVTDVLDLSWQLQRIKVDKAPADYEYREVEGTLYLTRPKSRAGWRVIPLVDPLLSILRRHIGDRTTGLVFENDGRPLDPDTVTAMWADMLAEVGVNPNVVLHGARHTTVDLLYAAGVDEELIGEIVGHSTRQVTRGYKSRNRDTLRAAMISMSKLLGDTPEIDKP